MAACGSYSRGGFWREWVRSVCRAGGGDGGRCPVAGVV